MLAQRQRVVPIQIEEEMQKSYLDFSFSTIMDRALPDARDGLKPSQRRILVAMHDLGLDPSSQHRKCAKIAGNTSGDYHPHGEAVVYPTLVRMAQDFNMRYPLVDGQGNFGCFTGDTQVRLADGTSRSFKELVEDYTAGQIHFTYTVNSEGRIEMAPILAPRLTRQDTPIVCVTLDNGERIRCTPDHRFMLRDGTYRQAHDLQPGDSLMPFYARLYDGEDTALHGYEEIYQPAIDKWQFTHHLADEYNLRAGVYERSAGRVRHHRDFNRLNNDPRNVERMQWADHFRLHAQLASRLWDDENFRRKMSEMLAEQWQDPEFREKVITATRKKNRVLWQNPEFRQTCLQVRKRLWADPAFREKIHRFKNGLERFFAGNCEALREACLIHTDRLNHRVMSVEPAGRADVYDLTIEGTHNFALASGVFVHNSVDGYPAAAMRYTEARMTPLTMEMLADLDKDTVDFIPNYDDTKKEPTVLPSRFPNLICNGSWGIAVAMTCKIPPHNLGEVVDGLLALIDDPDLEAGDLMRWIKAPDFPTGGIIYGAEGVKDAYTTGTGKIIVRARAFIETSKGKDAIVVTEIPYMVSKATLLEGIAELVRDRKIDGIVNIRDESDREGMRIVFEIRRDARPNVVLNQLYKHTELQTTYGVIMLALSDGRPKILTLKQILQCYIDHRHEVVVRRTQFELEKAQARAHILEGLRIALDHLDEIIMLIRQSPTPDAARIALIERYILSEAQAHAILAMTLQRLTGMERRKIEEEYLDLIKHISELEGILANRARRMEIIKDELKALKEKYTDGRRTEVILTGEEFRVEDLIADEEMIVTISHVGYIKRSPVGVSRRQRRGGKGLTGMTTRDEDFVEHLFIASTHAYILFLTDKGRCYWLKVYEIPQTGRASKGRPVVNLLDIGRDEQIAAIVPVREFDDQHYLIMATRQGLVKKTFLSAYANPRRAGITAINILEDDRLIEATVTDGHQEIILATQGGQAVRFPESEVRDMGRSTQGVKGATLKEEDEVVGMVVVGREGTLLAVTENGYGKRSTISDYRMTHRGGKGVIAIKVNERNGGIISIKEVVDEDELMIISQKGLMIRLPIRDIRVIGRNTQGVRLINLSEGDKVVDVARVAARDEEEEGENGENGEVEEENLFEEEILGDEEVAEE